MRQTVSASSVGTSMVVTANQCPTLGAEVGPIIVRQVIGEMEKQKVLDIHVVVPEQKPAIEQIIDVFVKDVEVNSVDIIFDKVIVRGDLEIKAIYVACVPEQSVHAVELKNVKWTQDIDLPGARRGMDADASVVVEFVDYDIECNTRAYRHKYGTMSKFPHNHNCDEECHEEDECEDECTREFDVSIVLKITAKVLADREVQIGVAGLPTVPKG